MSVARGSFVVRNRLGLHARAATKLVEIASRYRCDVTVSREDQSANAKSVMGVLLLCGCTGSRLDVEATGDGAEAAVQAIGDLIDNLFGEAE